MFFLILSQNFLLTFAVHLVFFATARRSLLSITVRKYAVSVRKKLLKPYKGTVALSEEQKKQLLNQKTCIGF